MRAHRGVPTKGLPQFKALDYVVIDVTKKPRIGLKQHSPIYCVLRIAYHSIPIARVARDRVAVLDSNGIPTRSGVRNDILCEKSVCG